MEEKEVRVRSITKLYYSKPEVQAAIFSFAKDREVVPRYFEGFGKRPDMLQYPSDLMGLVYKGATSFHGSEEIWMDPLKIDSNFSPQQLAQIRKGWDLLIDIDSPFLDYSKVAAKLLLEVLEKYGIKNYGIKFSGSKGFHLIVPAAAFPPLFNGVQTSTMFPDWPRAICEFLLLQIRPKYNKMISAMDVNFKAVEERLNLTKEDLLELRCPNPQCGRESKKGILVVLTCNRCGNTIQRPNFKPTKRQSRCVQETCPGFYEVSSQEEYFYCEHCGFNSRNKKADSDKKVTYSDEVKKSDAKFTTDFKEEVVAEKMASLDLVLVASRHLFRMPYSLHEKTSLASVVLNKDEIESFVPSMASPLTVKIRPFYLPTKQDEARALLFDALAWKESQVKKEEAELNAKYKSFDETPITGATEEMFPAPIKKLLKGLTDGKKRGLFVLLTFLRTLNFSPEYINAKVREWNKLNEPPLKEGYIRSQIEWHFRQQKKIMPPNYSNNSFYKDLNLLDKEPKSKNPIVDVLRELRK